MEREHPVAARARALIGVRFRPQGRRPEHGLDCVGLVAVAARLSADMVPAGYRLRSRASEGMLAREFGAKVRRIAAGDAGAGDVLLVTAAPKQHHLVVLVEGGHVHADARIGRVVFTPGAAPWPTVAAWRVREG